MQGYLISAHRRASLLHFHLEPPLSGGDDNDVHPRTDMFVECRLREEGWERRMKLPTPSVNLFLNHPEVCKQNAIKRARRSFLDQGG